MQMAFGGRTSRPIVGRRFVRPTMFNEVEVRAAAGLTLVVGAVAFCYAYFDGVFVPLRVVSTVFFLEFLIRVTIGLRYSPMGVIARLLTRDQTPQWVSAKPKRFAWQLGMALAFSLMIITNSGSQGLLPRTICVICLTLMWLEAALGLCLGCKLYALMARRGWTAKDPDIICAGGVCQLPAQTPNAEGKGFDVHIDPPRARARVRSG